MQHGIFTNDEYCCLFSHLWKLEPKHFPFAWYQRFAMISQIITVRSKFIIIIIIAPVKDGLYLEVLTTCIWPPWWSHGSHTSWLIIEFDKLSLFPCSCYTSKKSWLFLVNYQAQALVWLPGRYHGLDTACLALIKLRRIAVGQGRGVDISFVLIVL